MVEMARCQRSASKVIGMLAVAYKARTTRLAGHKEQTTGEIPFWQLQPSVIVGQTT